jgi:hypothetical protein
LCSRLVGKEQGVPGDFKECRKNAWQCADLAHTATRPELKQTFIELSKNWLRLAIELERAQTLLSEYPPDTKKQA